MQQQERRQQQKDLWAKKCPKCGHSALEHRNEKPGEGGQDQLVLKRLHEFRYCHHPIPSGIDDYFGFCQCEIDGDDYHRVGNHALIRVTSKKVER